MNEEVVIAFEPVANLFSELGIRYYVGGSVASSIHGAMRNTMDIDVAADLDQSHVAVLVERLSPDYYISEAAARDAIRHRSCFNLIHYQTSFKVDIFINRNRDFDNFAFDRVTLERISDSSQYFPVATREDIMILKLEWFRKGNETSERQWDDLSRLYQMHVDGIDHEYMTEAAASIQILDLLERLRAEFES